MSFQNDQKLLTKTTPELCIKCHEMFGHQTFANMCSKCFKLQKLQSEAMDEKKNASIQEPQIKRQPQIEQLLKEQKRQAKEQIPHLRRETNPNMKKHTQRQRTRQKQQKKTINKCFTCNKKTGMLGHECKHCSNVFCKFHRLPEDHECGVDFISAGRKILTAANPELKTRKVSGIDNQN